MKYRHYAPKGELVVVDGEPGKVVSYINEQTALREAQEADRDHRDAGAAGTIPCFQYQGCRVQG